MSNFRTSTRPATLLPPNIRFFSGRSESFIQVGSEWRPTSPEDEAHFRTGYDRETHEPNVGIYIVRQPNKLLQIGFDILRLNVSMRPAVIERLGRRWWHQSASLSKSLLRSVGHRVHFSKSFAQFEVSPDRLAEWKLELEFVLSDGASYESIERGTPDL
jgi:hypothetical protein